MAVVGLILALITLPAAILDVRLAAVLLALATGLTAAGLVRGHWAGLAVGALVVVLVGTALTGWELWELRRPVGTATVDLSAYDRPGTDRDVLLPLTVEVTDITALALVALAPDADPVYSDLEPQFIDRGHEQGFRVIAYRHDGFTDHYDDLSLSPDPDETSAVTGQGRAHYSHQDLGGPVLERDDHGRVTIRFAFTDVQGREIRATVQEQTTKQSVPLTMPAPVGMSSVHPEYFPLFTLNDFEFLRSGGTEIEVTIDEKAVELEPFPVPLPVQGQLRGAWKSALDAEIVAVFPTTHTALRSVRTSGDVFTEDGATYLFDGEALERIRFLDTEIVFTPPLDVARSDRGRFTITSYPERGSLAGPWTTSRDGALSSLEMVIDDVTVPRQRGLLYRLIVSDSSQFGRWPLEYRYDATMDLERRTIDARWTNARPSGLE